MKLAVLHKDVDSLLMPVEEFSFEKFLDFSLCQILDGLKVFGRYSVLYAWETNYKFIIDVS